MKITITSAQLDNLHACEDGIDDFVAAHGDTWNVNWSLEAQLEFIKGPLGQYFAWAVEETLLPCLSMAGVDLSGADLSCADLYRADLGVANLRRANLIGTNLAYANLCGADLTGADLTDADLSWADLTGAIGVER